jgi:hypothetical protein
MQRVMRPSESNGLRTPRYGKEIWHNESDLQQFPVDLNQDGFRGPGEALWHRFVCRRTTMPKAYSGICGYVIEMVQTGASRREAAEVFSLADAGDDAPELGTIAHHLHEGTQPISERMGGTLSAMHGRSHKGVAGS